MARNELSSRARRMVANVSVVMTLALAGATGLTVSSPDQREWRDYAGGPDSSRFVAAKQITKANVHQLQVAWTYPAGQTDFNPLVVRGVVYGRAANDSFVALEAATGKAIWTHEGVKGFNTRGVNYWESKDGKDRRLIFSSNNFLQELDAQTGQLIHDIRSERSCGSASGAGPGSLHDRSAEPDAGSSLREPDHPGFGDESGVRVRARRHPCVRCADGGAGLDLSHRAEAGRVRVRHVATGGMEDGRRRQQLGRTVDRREARDRLRPDVEPQVQLLRR